MITLSSSYNVIPTGTSIQIGIDVKNESLGISQDRTNTNLLILGIFATIVAIILIFLNVYRIANIANQSPMLEPDPMTRLELFAQLVPKKTYGDYWMAMQREQQNLVNSHDSIDCAICLEPVHSNQPVYTITCRHVFHDYCLERWVTFDNSACPICLEPLVGSSTTEEV